MPTAPDRDVLDRLLEHENLVIARGTRSGALGIVAVHSTALGPAVGGLRFQPYPTASAAVADALRLSRAMTLKNAAAGLDLGGGKAVLVATEGAARDDQLLDLADIVQQLGGTYVTAEDVGTTPADMDLIATRTAWVVGRSPEQGGTGDPSSTTARTVFGAIKEAARARWGTDDLAGRSVAVVGVGKVGAGLAALLEADGAELALADLNAGRAQDVAAAVGGTVLPLDQALQADVDVLAPCATGEMIGVDDVDRLRCEVIAGAANNPLVDDATAERLAARGILYVPDFLANCGGVIQVAADYRKSGLDGVDAGVALAVARIRSVLDTAAAERRPPIEVARELALAQIAAGPSADHQVASPAGVR
jgi:glutamate dehydrogenase/leucine dehydrogenase